MPTFDPEDLIGRMFILPPEANGESHRAKIPEKLWRSMTMKMVTE